MDVKYMASIVASRFCQALCGFCCISELSERRALCAQGEAAAVEQKDLLEQRTSSRKSQRWFGFLFFRIGAPVG